MGGIAIRKNGSTSQTTGNNAYTQITFPVTEFNTSTVLGVVGNTVRNISDKTLLVIATGTVVASASVASLTVRLSKVSDTTNAIGFMETTNTRAAVTAGIVSLAPNDSIQLETYNQITTADQRNRLSVGVLAILD